MTLHWRFSALPLLERLEIRRWMPEGHVNWQSLQWQTHSLKHLKPYSDQVVEDLALLETLSGNLESVDINLCDINSLLEPRTPSATISSFPRLTTLTIAAPAPAMIPFLSRPSFAASPIQHLLLDISSTPPYRTL